MAQEVITKLIDDLDGGEATETVHFSLDGDSFEIDLNAKNAAAFRKAFDRYREAARSGTSSGRSASSSRARGAGRSRSRSKGDVDPKAVRVWAAEGGIEVSSRGRIPASIIEQYKASGGA